jgi:N-acetylglutamate synthase-like GNAT family acetyltransferase
MKFVTYQDNYKHPCLAIFDSNTPLYFTQEERVEFEAYLNQPARQQDYFVVLDGSRVVGCGGFALEPTQARLCWGMVLRSCHKQGIGRRLLEYRLRQISLMNPKPVIGIDTSQHTSDFFKHFGFEVSETIENGYGQGLHKVMMQLCHSRE